MEKNIKDYMHLYLPFEFRFFGYEYTIISFKDFGHFFTFWHMHGFLDVLKKDFKLPLRPLSDMTEEEMIEVIQLTIPDNLEDKPSADNYDLDIFYNDEGTMVDADVVIGANFTCICYEGQIAFRKCGTVHFFNEDGELEMVYNMPIVYTFLLSRHFDLFGLIDAGLAIDKTKIQINV